MRTALLVPASLFAFSAAGCFIVPPPQPAPAAAPAATAAAPAAAPAATTEPLPQQPEIVETHAPSEPPADAPKGLAEGKPAGAVAGAPEAVWIWHDAAGWHLRTTTARNLHRFQGRVWGAKGKIGNVTPTRTELGDRFRKAGNWMFFDFNTKGGEDGFDFMVAESDCVHFMLTIDGQPQPSRIHVGAQGTSPPKANFRVCQ
ncbi:MAG: hypothetical protein IT374_09940 [Polyangiaceae bacterium]|nr:hypothetical protein [Polyangiaceae bacterium]